MAACIVKIVIMGHSFIRRLRDLVTFNAEFNNLCFSSSVFKVIFRTKGGLTIRQLANSSSLSEFYEEQDIGFLEISSNDLCDTSRTVKEIATSISSFASFLLITNKTKFVIIGQMKESVSKLIYPTLQHCLRLLYTMNGNSKH